MNKTKQQIEEVIKKNLPEKKDDDGFAQDPSVAFNNGFDEALSQIDTSLIADEVLKVVVEKIKEELENIPKVCCLEKIIEGACSCNNEGLPFYEVERIEQLLSNLSPNKENEIIHKICGTKSCKGEYKDGVVDYLCKKCDCTFLDNDEQTIIS